MQPSALDDAFAGIDELEKLVTLANDSSAADGERRNAALAACKRIAKLGFLTKLRAVKAWGQNSVTIERAHSIARFIDTFRAR